MVRKSFTMIFYAFLRVSPSSHHSYHRRRWQERVQPWVHYIPIQNDLSDLWDALTFFRGGPGGTGAHEDLARKIAEEGRRWSKRFWREEDMTAYMYRFVCGFSIFFFAPLPRTPSLSKEIRNTTDSVMQVDTRVCTRDAPRTRHVA